MSSDTKPDLARLRKLCDAASPGPWFYDSYSRVYSAPLCKLYREWHAKAIPPGALDDPAFDWEAAAASEPKTMVCSVPCRAGDTATEQGARDADFIEAARTAMPDLIAELERLAAQVEGYQALQTKQAEQGMETALTIRRLVIDKERLAAENAALKFDAHLHKVSEIVAGWPAWKQTAMGGKPSELAVLREENAALKAELATLRSQLSRIDYAFGEPNEMRCSPYDVDLDGERVVRQVEEMAKASQREPKTTMEAFVQLRNDQRLAMNQLVAVAASLGMCRVCGGSTERSGLIVTNHGLEFAHERCLKGEAKGGG